MQLLGHWNWWIPNWLERALPRLDVEPGAKEPLTEGSQ
jgi:RND superfamily putative drug exporter